MKIKLVGALISLFKTVSKDPVSNTIGELNQVVGAALGDEATKEKYDKVVQKIQDQNQTVVTRTGRGALLWCAGIVLVYQLVVRDALSLVMGIEPCAASGVDAGLLEQVIQLLSFAI